MRDKSYVTKRVTKVIMPLKGTVHQGCVGTGPMTGTGTVGYGIGTEQGTVKITGT